MKHRFLTLISSLLLLTACSDSFLERAPEGNYVDVTYYTSDDALEQATAPLYNRAWFDLNSRAIVPLGSNRANDNFSRWGAPEFTNFKVTALSENLANAWTGFYSVITMANAVISDVQTKCSNSVSERAKRTAIAEARLMRAEALLKMKQYKETMEDIDAVLAQNPEEETAILLRGKVKEANGQEEEAEADYQLVTEVNPFNEQAYLYLGQLFINQKKLTEAISLFDEAIELNPNFAEAYKERGRAKLLNGDKDGSVEDMKRSLELNPKDEASLNGEFKNLGPKQEALPGIF